MAGRRKMEKTNMCKILKGALVMLGLFAGCSENEATAQEPVEVAKGKVAVIYFSWSPDGNTRFAAETIAKKAEAKLFEIKAKTPYNSDFRACCDEAKPECYGKILRPIEEIEGLDLAAYDVVFFGTPNWWGTIAPPLRTFLAENAKALEGKTVALFQTHGGGGMQRLGKEFAEAAGEKVKVLAPKAFPGSSVRSATKALETFVTDRISIK